MEKKNIVCKESSRVLFGSVVYREALQYFDEFAESINRQTADNFGVLLINDGIPESEFEKRVLSIQNSCHIVQYETKYNPPQLRVKLIQEAKKFGADILIIGDADDLFSNNRIKNVIEAFRADSSADFAYNELRLFNGNRAMPEIPEKLCSIKDIAERNFLGMSNTAIRVSALEDSFTDSLLECDSYVFDWYLYSRLLLARHKAIKVNGTCTFYRIYDGNYAGLSAMTEEAVKKEIEIKKQHYNLLRKRDQLFEGLYNCYNSGRIQRTNLKAETDFCHYWWDFTKAAAGIEIMPGM